MAVIKPVFSVNFNAATSPGIVSNSWSVFHSGILGPVREIEVFNNTSQVLFLAEGNSGSERQLEFIIFPTGNPSIPVQLAQNTRLAIKGGNSATAGNVIINFYA